MYDIMSCRALLDVCTMFSSLPLYKSQKSVLLLCCKSLIKLLRVEHEIARFTNYLNYPAALVKYMFLR